MTAPAPEGVELQPIDLRYVQVLRIRAAIFWIFVLVLAVAAEFFLLEILPAAGLVAGPALLLLLPNVILMPGRRWRRWRYAFTGSELHVASGWWVQSHVIVPVVRIQHTDLMQGAIERGFGLATLVVHTAGSEANMVALPGVARETAEAIRDAILDRIGSLG